MVLSQRTLHARLYGNLKAAYIIPSKGRELGLPSNDGDVVAKDNASQKLGKSSNVKKTHVIVTEKKVNMGNVSNKNVVISVHSKDSGKTLKADTNTTDTTTFLDKAPVLRKS